MQPFKHPVCNAWLNRRGTTALTDVGRELPTARGEAQHVRTTLLQLQKHVTRIYSIKSHAAQAPQDGDGRRTRYHLLRFPLGVRGLAPGVYRNDLDIFHHGLVVSEYIGTCCE